MSTPNLSLETTYRRLVEHMNEAVCLTDRHGRVTYANRQFCSLLGYRLQEVIGRYEADFWDQSGTGELRRKIMKDRKHGLSSSYEALLLTKKGHRISVLVRGTSMPGGGTMGIITDLSELKEHESLYRRLVEHMNEAVWMLDEHDRTIYVNPKFCEITGYRPDELKGKQSYGFFDDESVRRIKQVNMHERTKGISSSYEATLITKNGKGIPVLISGTPMPDGGTIGIMTDLTELKSKEAQEKVLTSAVTYANDAIIIMDSKGMVESWNKGAKIIFGFKQDEILGQPLSRVFAKEDIESMLRNPEVRYNFELRGRHKNKQEVIVSATLTPVSMDNPSGASSCLLIARDITAQRRYDEELALKYQKLRDAYNQFGIVRRQMDYMFELLDLAVSTGNTKLIGDFAVNAVIMLTRVDACSIRLHNPHRNTMEILSSFGLGDEWKGKAVIPYNESLARRAFESGMPLRIIDLTSEPTYHSKHLAKKSNLTSILVIPLAFQGKLVGGLNLYVGPEKKLEIFENEFIEKFAKLIALALALHAH